MHVGSFRLPHSDGEFGSRATAAMPADGLFLALTEYRGRGGRGSGPGSSPARRRASCGRNSSAPHTLLRPVAGQRGAQRFFSAAGRAFCLYVVAGRDGGRRLAAANRVLASIAIEPG